MKAICDTNIWRKLALNEISESELLKADSQITATFINIDEIAKSHLVLNNIESAKQTVRRIIKILALIIFENPIIIKDKTKDLLTLRPALILTVRNLENSTMSAYSFFSFIVWYLRDPFTRARKRSRPD